MWCCCHRPDGKSHTDSTDFARSFELWALITHWKQRRSMTASILSYHTRERARPIIRTILMWVSWRRLSMVNLSVWGTTMLRPQSRILPSIVSASLRRWYRQSSSDGHLSDQPRWTKFWTFARIGFLSVAILHCLESIGVDSIRETWTGWSFNNSTSVDSVLDGGRRERSSALELSHPLRYSTW